jgi:hypothetical protein
MGSVWPVPFWLPKIVVTEVADRLAEGPAGPIATVNAPKIHKALRAKHPELALWSDERHELAAVVVGSLGKGPDWESRAIAWRATLAPGGQLISIDRGGSAEVSRRLLCSGFSDLSQVRVGRRVVTCGHLGPVPADRLC